MTDAERRRRVDEICHAALDRPAAERTAFVAAACGADERLWRDVEALLAHATTAADFLETPVAAVAAHVMGQVMGDDVSAALIGRTIGAYRILARLGAGGMGVVYRAQDMTLGADALP